MSFHTTQGIVLKAIPFKDDQKIVTLFSKAFGVISMILKKASPRRGLLPFTEPFCEAEFILRENRSDLFTFHEGSLIHLHLDLRTQLPFLQIASRLTQGILSSQLQPTASPPLYALLSSFLSHIPSASCLTTLLACFYLKILKHEGVYHPKSTEDNCMSFSSKEKELLEELMLCSSFSFLKTKTCSPELLSRLERVFFQKTSWNS